MSYFLGEESMLSGVFSSYDHLVQSMNIVQQMFDRFGLWWVKKTFLSGVFTSLVESTKSSQNI